MQRIGGGGEGFIDRAGALERQDDAAAVDAEPRAGTPPPPPPPPKARSGAGGPHHAFAADLAGESLKAKLARRMLSNKSPVLAAVPNEMVVPMGGKELASRLEGPLKLHVTTYNYDSMFVAEAVLDQATAVRARGLAVQTSARDARPQAAEALATHGGSQCVGLANDILSRLPPGLQGYVVASETPPSMRGPNDPMYGHAAALVAFRSPTDPSDRGFILLDPGLNLAEPIVVRPGTETVYKKGQETFTFRLDEGAGKIRMDRQARPGEPAESGGAFRVDQWRNAEALTASSAVRTTKLKLCARDEQGGVAAAVVMDLKKGETTIRVGKERASIPFADAATLERAVTPELAAILQHDRDELLGRLRRIVDGQGVLRQARAR